MSNPSYLKKSFQNGRISSLFLSRFSFRRLSLFPHPNFMIV
jgi:hypothetical protein